MNDEKLIAAPTAARAAAEWWADAIGAPTFRITDENSGPDERADAAFGSTMASILAARHPVSDETGRRFIDALEAIVAEGSHYSGAGLHTDYGPDGALAAAADAAGVDYSRFPYKTNMWIKGDHVYVSAGYGARSTLIWHAPDWQRPVCETQHYEGDDPRDEVCSLQRYHAGPCGVWRPDTKRCTGCGGTYSAHYSGAYWENPDRCRWKPEES